MDTRCYIGLPQWQHPLWHADRPNGLTALRRYATHFGSVEGNTSFYGAPKKETLERWLENTPDEFRFCFKVPRTISHNVPLHQRGDELLAFLDSLAFAKPRLGIIWLQLSDKLGPESLPALQMLFDNLPDGFNFGLEVRHKAFFDKGNAERSLNALLIKHQVNRVMFDTRLLFANRARDLETLEAQRKKPHVPLHVIATGQYPMVRFISPMDTQLADHALKQWAAKVSAWIAEGKHPMVFFHTPNNDTSPHLAGQFQSLLVQELKDYQPAIPWPKVASQNCLF